MKHQTLPIYNGANTITTGTIQFEDDLPGIYISNEDAELHADYLRQAINSNGENVLSLVYLEDLLKLLEDCKVD